MSSFDLIIIGSGSAGFSAAESAKALGVSVCLVEKAELGGECPNWACVPSKALLRVAKALHEVGQASRFGIRLAAPTISFSKVMSYRKRVVENSTGGGSRGDRYVQIAKQMGWTVKYGEARFLDAHTISVEGEELTAKAMVIATGARSFVPPIPGLASVPYIDFKQAVSLAKQPSSLAVIGGGPVGCELATFYGMLGTRVSLFQGASTILNREDPEIARLAHAAIGMTGVQAFGNATVEEVRKGFKGIELVVLKQGKRTVHVAEKLLLATGKRAAIGGLHVEDAGVKLDARGNPSTTDQQRTTVPHIFAAGDVDGGLQFTHTAHHEGSIAGYNAGLCALGKKTGFRRRDERVVPRATFTIPEVASVGMTGPEAKKAFGSAVIGRYPVHALGRANTDSAERGLMKLVAHPKTRKLVGGHMIGERAGEVIHEVALGIYLHATIDQLGSMIHAFPTYSEAVVAAANNLSVE